MRLFLTIITHLQRLGRISREHSAAAAAAGRLGDARVERRAGRIAARRETLQMGDDRQEKPHLSVVDPAAASRSGRCPFGDKSHVLAGQKQQKAGEVRTHDYDRRIPR